MTARVSASSHPLFDQGPFPGDLIERSAPRFRLTVLRKGSVIPADSRTLSELIDNFSIEEDDNMATMAKIKFDNPEFVLSRRDSLLQPGTILMIEIGYGKKLFGQQRAVEIVRLLPNFPQDEKPTYHVQGYDGRQRLLDANTLSDRGIDSGEKREVYGQLAGRFLKMTDDQIVQRITVQFGMGYDSSGPIFSAKKRRTRVKKKTQSWWDFIQKIAKKNKSEAWVDYDFNFKKWILHIRERDPFVKPSLRLVYAGQGNRGSLLSFAPKLDTIGQATSIKVLHFDRRVKRNRIVYVGDKVQGPADNAIEFEAAVIKLKVSGKMQHIFSTKPFKNKKDAQNFAEEYVRRNREDYIHATGKVIGTEILRPRQVHRIETGDKRFDGNYYLTQVTHSYPARGVYETSFVAFKVPSRFVVPKTIPTTQRFNFQADNLQKDQTKQFQPFLNFDDPELIV